MSNWDRVYKMSFTSVYPQYVRKAEAKGRSRQELDEVIRWLTGYSQDELEAEIARGTDMRGFFRRRPAAESRALADHRHDLRRPGRDDRGAAEARDPLPRQAGRRAGEGTADEQNPSRRVKRAVTE